MLLESGETHQFTPSFSAYLRCLACASSTWGALNRFLALVWGTRLPENAAGERRSERTRVFSSTSFLFHCCAGTVAEFAASRWIYSNHIRRRWAMGGRRKRAASRVCSSTFLVETHRSNYEYKQFCCTESGSKRLSRNVNCRNCSYRKRI